jgi:hypothetical protein
MNSKEWLQTTTKNMRNFIRKWGSVVLHDKYMKPIVLPKYDIGVVLPADPQLLQALEPWFSSIYLDTLDTAGIQQYFLEEQGNTSYKLRDRIKKNIPENINNDVVVSLTGVLNNIDFGYIQQLPQILKENGEIGIFELGNLRIEVNSLKQYQDSLIFI